MAYFIYQCVQWVHINLKYTQQFAYDDCLCVFTQRLKASDSADLFADQQQQQQQKHQDKQQQHNENTKQVAEAEKKQCKFLIEFRLT